MEIVSEVVGRVDEVSATDGTNRTNGTDRTNGTVERGTDKKALSKWRAISGITVENERTMTAAERRAAIRKLKDVVEREIREELNAANEDVELMVERTHLWEPTLAICRKLEIGPAVLSRLMRELTGISTSQMVDKIRGEGLKEKLRENLIGFVLKNFKRPGVSQNGTGDFWEKLRAIRRQARFSYASWAIDLGFANYTRFYRACLLCFRQTPTQIEDEILREFGEWFTLARELLERKKAEIHTWMKEFDKHRKPYADGWSKALRERPEFVARMRRELELDESVIALAGE